MKSQRSRDISTAVASAKDVTDPHVEVPLDTAPMMDLFRQLQQLQAQAKALGIFTDERDLLTCPNCGLFEDVTCDGFLITSRTLSKDPIDTGLRFHEITPDTFRCPSCQSEVQSTCDLDESDDSKAPTGRPNDSPRQRPGSTAPVKSGALKGRNKGGAA